MTQYIKLQVALLIVLVTIQGRAAQQMDPRTLIQYDARKLPSFYKKIGNITESQFIVLLKNVQTEGFSSQNMQDIFSRVSGSSLEATSPYTAIQQFPYYALRTEDLLERYSALNNPAQEIQNMAPAILACKLDQNCAFDVGLYPPDLSTRNKLVGTKVALGIIYIIENIIAILLPWIVKKNFNKSDFILSIFSCFSAGILLGAAFLELIPLGFQYTSMQKFYNGFPVSFAITLAAYFIYVLIDSVLLNNKHSTHGPDTQQEQIGDAEKVSFSSSSNLKQPQIGKGSPTSYTSSHYKKLSDHRDRLQRPTILLFGYLLQSVMIFLALGLQENARITAFLGIGVFLWQGGEIMAISTSFMKSNCSLAELLIVMLPASVLPSVFLFAGIGINHISLPLQMIFISFAAGSFIYTATSQILQDEMDHVTGKKSGWQSYQERYTYFGCLLFGIAVLVLAKLIPSNYSTVLTYINT